MTCAATEKQHLRASPGPTFYTAPHVPTGPHADGNYARGHVRRAVMDVEEEEGMCSEVVWYIIRPLRAGSSGRRWMRSH